MSEEIVQGSEAWIQIRLGKVTASRIADLTARTKSGWSASRANYEAELIAERLTGQPAERYTNAAMTWGTQQEPEARRAYEFLMNTEVREVGFVHHPHIDMSGCSPDGLVGEDGLIEIKAPLTATHLATLLGDPIDGKYIKQMQWQMECCGRYWCDWVSYAPRLPEPMRLFVKRVMRDNNMIADLEVQVIEFLKELDRKLFELSALYPDAKTVAA